MKFQMTARKKDGDIMRAVFEADDEAQARELIQEADGTLELVSLEPVVEPVEPVTPEPSTPSESGKGTYGKPAGCLGAGAIIAIVIKVLVFGMRCAQDPVMKQPPQPFVPPRPVPGQRQPALPMLQDQALKHMQDQALKRRTECAKLDDLAPALRQRMQQTDDEEIRDKCRRALDALAKLKALPLNTSDEEWEKQSLAARKAIADAMPRNAPAKGTAKTSATTAKKE
jgi:hypothetical protein